MWAFLLGTVPLAAESFCPLGGWTQLQAPATGFFTVREIEGVWWWIDPHRHAFLSKGVNHITFQGDPSPALGYSPYRRAIEAKYGSEERWAEAAVRRLWEWNFNTIGAWSSQSVMEQGMPYTLILNLGARAGADWLSGKVLDVFGDHFAQVADRIASEQCAPRREDPRLLGYFTDNELRWGPDWRSPKTLLADYWEMPPEAAGRQAVREFLQEHYGTVERFNAEWGTKYTSFEEIFAAETLEAISPNVARAQGAIRWRRAVQWVPRERRLERAREWFGTVEGLNREFGTQFRSLEEAVADESPDPYERALRELADAFTLRVAEQYFRVCAEAIRRHDPNHLILGCRFAGYAPRSVLVGMKNWVDVVSYNNYDFQPPVERLREVYRLTGRPILLTEFSFKAKDSGLPNTKGAGTPVETQKDRADHFERYVTTLMELPFVIGYHWFQYSDQPPEGRFDGENSNFGLVTLQDEPWELLTERMREVNGRIESVHRSAGSR